MSLTRLLSYLRATLTESIIMPTDSENTIDMCVRLCTDTLQRVNRENQELQKKIDGLSAGRELNKDTGKTLKGVQLKLTKRSKCTLFERDF